MGILAALALLAQASPADRPALKKAPPQEVPVPAEPLKLERPRREPPPPAPDLLRLSERPTFTWMPHVAGLGRIVAETGVEFALEDGERLNGRTFTVPTLVRYGASEALEVFVKTDALIDRRGEDPETGGDIDALGLGDLTLGTKWGMLRDEGLLPSVGSIGLWKLPTADDGDGLGSGEGDLYFLTAFGKGFGDSFALFANLGLGFISDTEEQNAFLMRKVAAAEGRLQLGSVTLLGEIVWMSQIQPQAGVETTARVGAAVFVTGDFRLDAGLRIGLSEEAEDFAFTIGVSIALGRFW